MQQIAEVEPNIQQISAETTTLAAGEEYVVPEDGIYRIELYGGSTSRVEGCKVVAYRRFNEGERLRATEIAGGAESSLSLGKDEKYEEEILVDGGAPGIGLDVEMPTSAYDDTAWIVARWGSR